MKTDATAVHPAEREHPLSGSPLLNAALARERTRLRVVASLIACPGDVPLRGQILAQRLGHWR